MFDDSGPAPRSRDDDYRGGRDDAPDVPPSGNDWNSVDDAAPNNPDDGAGDWAGGADAGGDFGGGDFNSDAPGGDSGGGDW